MAKLRILVADDDEGVRESLRLVLSHEFDVNFSKNGQEALAKLKRQRFDLALLDINMPKVDGLEILRFLKKTRLRLPVLMLTAYQSVELAKEAIKLGAVDYVPKPFTSDQILAAVHHILAHPSAK